MIKLNPEKPTPTPCPGIFTQTYNQFRKLGIENPNWNENTAKATFSFFERNVLPPLDCYGYGLCSEDIATIQTALVEKAAKNKGGRQNLNIAENSVSSYLFRVNWILTNMYALNTALPEHLFRTKAHAKIPLTEQAKFLPDKVRVILAFALCALTSNGLSLGVAAMLLMGLRTSEACALQIGAITLRDGWFVDCPVLFQIKDGKRIPRLKTIAGYRHAIGGCLMHHLIITRCEYLRSLGYDGSDIPKMPLVSSPKSPEQYADSSALSA